MSKRANPVFVGAFVSIAIALAVIALIIFSSGNIFRPAERFVLYFEDSVNGLEVGAPVKFKGVRIGQVKEIYIRFNQAEDSAHVPVIIEIDTRRLQKHLGVEVNLADPEVLAAVTRDGLRAKLQLQSFVTGVLFIELDYFPSSGPPVLIQKEFMYPEIPTVFSPNITAIFRKVTDMLDEMTKIDISAIGQHATSLLERLDAGVAAIEFEEINKNVVAATVSANELLADPNLKASLDLLRENLEQLKKLTTRIDDSYDPLVEEVSSTLLSARNALATSEALMKRADDLLDPDATFRYQLDSALGEMAAAMRSIRMLAEYLERNPNAILTGKPENKE